MIIRFSKQGTRTWGGLCGADWVEAGPTAGPSTRNRDALKLICKIAVVNHLDVMGSG
jgi:hypothetical protein